MGPNPKCDRMRAGSLRVGGQGELEEEEWDEAHLKEGGRGCQLNRRTRRRKPAKEAL